MFRGQLATGPKGLAIALALADAPDPTFAGGCLMRASTIEINMRDCHWPCRPNKLDGFI